MKPRRVLIFSLSYYPLLIGGAEVAVKEITDRIPAGEMEFDMVTIGDGRGIQEEKVGNVNVFRLFKKSTTATKLLFPFAAAARAKKLHAQKAYDTAWAIMASYAGYAAYLFKKKNPAIPLVLTIQEGDHFGRRHGVFFRQFRKIFRAADHISAISRFLLEWSKDMGATCPITIVPNGVDVELFSRSSSVAEKESIRQAAGFASSDFILITASRLVYKNATDDIIESLAFLPKEVKLWVLGTGPDEVKLKSLVTKLALESSVVFQGFVTHAELPKYLQASDVFVRPSRTEGLGNSFLEAMAAGIPVIATPVGGIPDFLTDGETGYSCDVDNPRSIAQKVEKIMRDKESRDYVVKQAKDRVVTEYGWNFIFGKMKAILQGKI